jgi:hypothetical protein
VQQGVDQNFFDLFFLAVMNTDGNRGKIPSISQEIGRNVQRKLEEGMRGGSGRRRQGVGVRWWHYTQAGAGSGGQGDGVRGRH